MRKQYRQVNLPLELIELVDKLVAKYGFNTRAEFVREAVRDQIEEYYREAPQNVPERHRML